jgi:hypothetical protein
MQFAARDVDGDLIAVLDDCQGAALSCLRRNVADKTAVVRAGEAAIRYQRGLGGVTFRPNL